MKKERIEDLGCLSERLDAILDLMPILAVGTHTEEEFARHYKENMQTLHGELIYLREQILECWEIAKGEKE